MYKPCWMYIIIRFCGHYKTKHAVGLVTGERKIEPVVDKLRNIN